MIGVVLAFALAGATAPAQLVVTTPRGETRIAVSIDGEGRPMVAALPLAAALGGALRQDGYWATVVISRQDFSFLVGAPLYRLNDHLEPLSAPAVQRGDSVFLPYQFVSEILPRFLGELYQFDRVNGRLVQRAPPPPPPPAAAGPKRLPNGLLPGHVVTVDAGHGGVDPGNPGRYFPAGVTEKNVTLQVALLVRDELLRQGVGVIMTRTTDTLINLRDRAPYCADDCELFVSLHVNSLARRAGYTSVRGFDTYFLGEAKTEEADRVARMENDAIRYEAPSASGTTAGGLDFILRDLQANEYLRESARAAELVQASLDPVHTGDNRGVKQAGYAVLTTARRPAILVEMGFSTNPEDGRLLSSRNSQRQLARAIAEAVVNYLREFERKSGVGPDTAGRGQ